MRLKIYEGKAITESSAQKISPQREREDCNDKKRFRSQCLKGKLTQKEQTGNIWQYNVNEAQPKRRNVFHKMKIEKGRKNSSDSRKETKHFIFYAG